MNPWKTSHHGLLTELTLVGIYYNKKRPHEALLWDWDALALLLQSTPTWFQNAIGFINFLCLIYSQIIPILISVLLFLNLSSYTFLLNFLSSAVEDIVLFQVMQEFKIFATKFTSESPYVHLNEIRCNRRTWLFRWMLKFLRVHWL